MYVQYWSAGTSVATDLPMEQSNIRSHLLADWVPSIPVSVSSSFMGWPLYLTEGKRIGSQNYLTLCPILGTTERQWKGFFSWMLGVAGTRHVLEKERYRWIAPASAFYSNSVQTVDPGSWHLCFPRSVVEVTARASSVSRLRPDYLAIRPGKSMIEWAVAESKGTSQCLTNMNLCPRDWRDQVRNIVVKVCGRVLSIPRHIVVATRSNPNAIGDGTRRIQIRAWNSVEESSHLGLPYEAVTEIVAAHLFGLFKNLGLRKNARAIAYSVQERAKPYSANGIADSRNLLSNLREEADNELEQKSLQEGRFGNITLEFTTIDPEFGRYHVEINEATLALAKKISTSLTKEESIDTYYETNNKLDDWHKSQKEKDEKDVVLPSGIRVSFPK